MTRPHERPKRDPRPTLTLFALVAAASPAAAQAPACPGIPATGGSLDQIDAFYIGRSRDILAAALAGDVERLRPLVAGDAEFTLWRGDQGLRPRRRGAKALVEFMQQIVRPVRYQAQTRYDYVLYTPAPCNWEVPMLLRTGTPGRAAALRFKYRDGRLIDASGTENMLLEGDLTAVPPAGDEQAGTRQVGRPPVDSPR